MSTRVVPAEIQEQIDQRDMAPVILIDMEFESGTVYLWSGIGDLLEGGNTYLGVGSFLGIQPIKEATELKAFGTQIILSGIPSELIAAAYQSEYQGRTARIFMGVLSNGLVVQVTAIILDLPLITELEASEFAPHLSATTDLDFPAQLDFFRRTGGGSPFTLAGSLTAESIIGQTLSAITPFQAAKWDRDGQIDVTLDNGTLISASEIDVLNGTNWAAIKHSNEWEIIGFQTAVSTGTSSFRLTDLLRGLRGTDTIQDASLAAGADFVLLNSDVLQATSFDLAEVSDALTWSVGPEEDDPGDPSYQEQIVTVNGVGTRPYAPAHIAGVIDGSNDWIITWFRQDRFGMDWPDGSDIPMSEVTEEYRIQIMDGAVVKRTISGLLTETGTYTSAQQVTDFGSNQTQITVRVSQLSAIFGFGEFREATLDG